MLINRELYDKVSELTYTNYEPSEVLNNDDVLYLDGDSVQCMLEDLLYEVDKIQEKYDDLEQDLEDNYRPITKEEMYLG